MKKDTLDPLDFDDEPEAPAHDEAKALARRDDPPESHAAAAQLVDALVLATMPVRPGEN